MDKELVMLLGELKTEVKNLNETMKHLNDRVLELEKVRWKLAGAALVLGSAGGALGALLAG